LVSPQTELREQSSSDVSVPPHCTSSSPMLPVPGPYSEPSVSPMCLHRQLQRMLCAVVKVPWVARKRRSCSSDYRQIAFQHLQVGKNAQEQ